MTITISIGIGSLVVARRKQKKFFGFLSLLGFLGFMIITYASFIEPQIIVVTKVSVTHPNAQKLKIAIVSDPHVGPYKDDAFLERVVLKLNGLLPDIVLMPGDFVFTRSADPIHLAPFAKINAPLGVFAVLGNHDDGQYLSPTGERYSGKDRGENIAQKLEQFSVKVLRNEHKLLPLTHANIAVAGIDDLWTGHHNLPASLQDIPPDTYTILLSHNPSVIDEPESAAADLIVSGHTHGGQLRIPSYGPLTELPTSLGRSFDQGLFPLEDGRTLAITRGIGESGARSRLLAWPEILVVELSPTR